MIEYLYSNMKSIDVQREYTNMQHVGITHYIVDYEPTPAVPMLLKLANIKCYYRIKIHPCEDIKKFNFGDFESKVKHAKRMGFDGIAIDAEAYSDSPIWKESGAREFGKALSGIIGKEFNRVAIFPENLGGEKYEHYDSFLEGVFSLKKIKQFDLLMERSYNQGEFYNILAFYLVQQEKYRKFPNVRVFPGIWPDCPDPIDPTKPGLSEWERRQQMDITRIIGKRFYYSETTDYSVGR